MRIALLIIGIIVFSISSIAQTGSGLLVVNTRNLEVTVDGNTCRWSAKVKGTEMQINDVYFLPGNNPSGWKVESNVNNADLNKYGSFVTVNLHGTKPGELDFDYQISVSKSGNAVANDPYQLRIYVPDGFTAKLVELSDGLVGTMKKEGKLLTVYYKTANNNDVEWKVIF